MPPRRRQPRKGGKARRRQAPERPACENRPLFSQTRKTSWTQNASTRLAARSQTSPPAPPSYGGIFDYPAKADRLRTVNAALEDPAVWNDPQKAQELGKEKKRLDDVYEQPDSLQPVAV